MQNLSNLLQRLEAELHHPGIRCSRERLEQLLHPGFHEVGRSGRRYTRETVIAYLVSQTEPPSVESGNYRVYPLAEGCVLLTYSSAHRASDGSILDAALRSSIWRRTESGWQLYYHQGTPRLPGVLSPAVASIPETRIVRFEPSDWEVYRNLRLAALRESPEAFGSTLEAEESQPDGHWVSRLSGAHPEMDFPLAAWIGDEPVGLAWARIEPESEVAGRIYQMWVSPKARGQGVAGALMRALVGWFEAAGVSVVELNVTRGNSPATKLYERYGFQPVGEPEPLRPGSELLVDRMWLRFGDE